MNTNKTNRKNKTKLTINWPSSYFTYDQLFAGNSHFVPITLRVRLKNASEKGVVLELGTKNLGKGRPQSVYAVVPVSPETMEAAKDFGVMFHESLTVKVVDVKETVESTEKVETVNQTA